MRVPRPVALLLAFALAASGAPLGAQDPAQAPAQAPATVTVRGVAFDSLRVQRLRGALLSLERTGQTAISDDSGLFHFDGVAPGAHTLLMQHDALDSLGIAVVRRDITVSDGRETVRIAVPSIETLWWRTCGRTRVPSDSGFVFGAVRDARTGDPVPGARLFITWSEIEYDRQRGVRQDLLGGELRTASDGSYTACGLPTGMMLELRLAADGYATLGIDVPLAAPGVLRQDLFVRARGDSLLTGTVRGVVRGLDGAPVARAGVARPGDEQLLTDAAGRFVMPGVPIGTNALDVRSIGSAPFTVHLRVAPDDTVDVVLGLRRLSVLQEVRVAATSLVVQRFVNELAERRALGIATIVDSTAVSRRGTIVGALSNAAHLWVNNRGRIFIGPQGVDPCAPRVWIDRRQLDDELVQDELKAVSVENIGAIEVYQQSTMIPQEFWGRGPHPCAVIVIWTKRMFP